MDKKEILETIQEVRKDSKKRNFNQTFDLIMNFINLDLKNPDHNINMFLKLPFSKGKQNKVAIFVDKELVNKAKGVFDEVIIDRDFALYKDKKKIKSLARGIDFFVAQANIMPKIATTFGRVLGPVGKMPNPKAGCIVPPSIQDLKPIVEKLRNIVKLQTKNELGIKVSVGKEDAKDDEIAENILVIYNQILHTLPQEKQNIKSVLVKLTMGKAFLVGKKAEKKAEEPKEEKLKEKKIKKEVKKEVKKEEKKKVKKVKEKDGKA
jgi:large subunit ribosomal protein L1